MPLKVELKISKNEGGGDDDPSKDPRMTKSLANLDLDTADEDEDTQLYKMGVESSGKYTRKATWQDLNRYTGMQVNEDTLRDWIVNYQKRCFPEDLQKENHVPVKCYIKDEKGGTIYEDFDWKPIKLNLTPGMVDVKERWTKEVCLESFPLDYSTSLEQILLEQGDKKITSTLRKSKLQGHELAKEMMKTDSDIATEFQGIESVAFGVLGNKEPSEVDEDTGDELWKDVKSLRALLHGATMPKKEGAGVTREAKVVADESFLKARIYYKCYFSNDVATDHELPFDGKPYWKFPMKYLLQYNGMPKQVVVYEDVELRFFTDIRIGMENKDWQWVKDENGRWKKQFAAVMTSMSRRKPDNAKVPEPTDQATLEYKENEENAVDEKDDKDQSPSPALEAETSGESTAKNEHDENTGEAKDEEENTPSADVTAESGGDSLVNHECCESEEEEKDEKEEKENSPAFTVEAEPDGDFLSKDDTKTKPDPDGAVLEDSVSRMSVGEGTSLEP